MDTVTHNKAGPGGQEAVRAAQAIDDLAAGALLQEVLATPKPGLVDRANPGAHSDMDLSTFEHSIDALRGYFGRCFAVGYAVREAPPPDTLPRLQQLGLAAEADMFAATGGVNTHKGAIFSLGLLCGGAGRLHGRNATRNATDEARLRAEAAAICAGLTAEALADIQKKPHAAWTKGERMQAEHGMAGARGEAESGYATVGRVSLPVFSRLMDQGVAANDALAETLLHLIAATEDTNIAARHDRPTAAYARGAARRCLEQGGLLGAGGLARVRALDRDFIARNISPGGSADLLAVTWFLYHLPGRAAAMQTAHGRVISPL